jgi:hypothetical protein
MYANLYVQIGFCSLDSLGQWFVASALIFLFNDKCTLQVSCFSASFQY